MKKTIKLIVMAALCLKVNTKAQEPTKPPPLKSQGILGKVISATTREALPGAVIKITNTNQTVLSNDQGEFILSLTKGSYNLSAHYLSYKAKSISIQIPLQEPLFIELEADDNSLKEVEINAGYYTVKDKERTGSISRVTAETIGKQPVSNPLAALIGRMAGVNIQQSSGINGGGFKVEIRGRSSLRASGVAASPVQPLYLIDGVPYPATPMTNPNFSIGGITNESSPLSFFSPSDIESIEVLKDADATAIYGSRGANGVVLIKTKSAKRGRTGIDINVYSGISHISNKLDLLSAEDYFQMRKEAFKNDNVNPGTTDYDLNGTWDQKMSTDWQEELVGGTAHNTSFNMGISGGSEFTQFAVRGNYIKNTTVSFEDFANEKGSGALTANHSSLDKRFTAHFAVIYNLDYNSLPQNDLMKYATLAPNAPSLYDSNGNINWALNSLGSASWENPIATTLNKYSSITNNFSSNGFINYEIIKGLNIRSAFGYNSIDFKQNILYPISAQVPSNFALAGNSSAINANTTYNFEPQINYARQFGPGKLDVLAGSTIQGTLQSSLFYFGYSYSDLTIENISAAPIKEVSLTSSKYKYLGFFGRLNYSIKDTYFINLTGRRDGSSRFGPDKKFGNFAALGVAWIFSNEEVIKTKLPFLSTGKLRGSYGITGSDQIPDYGFLETYTSSLASYGGSSTAFPTRISNPDYSWEINRKLELALNLGLLGDRIVLSANWYRNRSSNQLVGYTLPAITGFNSIQYNLPATVQNKGWEFELQTNNIKTASFSWTTSLNLTVPENKLLSYPNILGSSYANLYTVGKSLYQPKLYQYQSVNENTGLYEFNDVNGNGILDVGDRTVSEKALSSHSFGGLLNSLNYKDFGLDLFFQFADKTERDPISDLTVPGRLSNQLASVMGRWINPGDKTEIQKFTQKSGTGTGRQKYNDYLVFSSRSLTDASFIRLKNVSFSWTVPENLVRKLKVRNLKVYIQGQNLFTISKYPGDPEVGYLLRLPTLTTVTAGLQLGI